MSRTELHQAKSEIIFIVNRNLSVWTLIAVLSCHKVFACATALSNSGGGGDAHVFNSDFNLTS